MVKYFCDRCGVKLADRSCDLLGPIEETYEDFLARKGANGIIVSDISKVIKVGDRYRSSIMSFCDKCQDEIDKLVLGYINAPLHDG